MGKAVREALRRAEARRSGATGPAEPHARTRVGVRAGVGQNGRSASSLPAFSYPREGEGESEGEGEGKGEGGGEGEGGAEGAAAPPNALPGRSPGE
jgi:hypothetical protein